MSNMALKNLYNLNLEAVERSFPIKNAKDFCLRIGKLFGIRKVEIIVLKLG